MTRARGFSMMELVVTLVIAAIIAAIAIPNLRFGDTQAAWYFEEVRAAVRYAQRQAVAQRRPVFVVVLANQVDLCYDAACVTRLQRITTGQPYSVAAPAGVALAPQVFSFTGLGQPSGPVALNIAGQVLTVTAETGYVP